MISAETIARAVAAGLLTPLEAAVADHLCDKAGVTDPAVRFVAALAIRAPRIGDVCAAPLAFDAVTEARRARAVQADAPAPEAAADPPSPTAPDTCTSTDFAIPVDIASRLETSGLFDRAAARRAVPAARDAFTPVTRAPFVVDTHGPELLVWTDRYFTTEARLAAHVAARAIATPPGGRPNPDPLAHVAVPLAPWFRALFPEAIAPPQVDHPDFPWSALAAAVALTAPLTILTGGPGTGKTYAVRKMLLLHRIAAALDGRPAPRLALAAPTGKAAARLREALVDQLDRILADFSDACAAARLDLPPGVDIAALRATVTTATPMTLHRLLRIHPDRPTRPHHGPERPLPADLVVVDEASMVDLPLMTRLFDALAPATQLLILGDHHQLASVEAGSVLGDLVALPSFHVPSFSSGPGFPPTAARMVPVVALRRSRRFSDTTPMGRFARALTTTPFDRGHALALAAQDADSADGRYRRLVPPDAWAVLPPLDTPSSDARVRRFAAAIDKALCDGFLPYLLELHAGPRPGEDDDSHLARVLEVFDTFRVLCGHRRGPLGVEALNRRVPALLMRLDPGADPTLGSLVRAVAKATPQTDVKAMFQAAPAYWPGRPLLVTRNDPTLGLQNGDVGIVADRTGSDWRVVFPGTTSGTIRRVPASLLPPHETAFAMTIHKSQGSQYRHVMVVLPERESPIVTRELVYTAVTRMTRDVTLVATERVLALALEQTVVRRSDLTRRILADLGTTVATDAAVPSTH